MIPMENEQLEAAIKEDVKWGLHGRAKHKKRLIKEKGAVEVR